MFEVKVVALALLICSVQSLAREVVYDISIDYQVTNISGKNVKVIALGKTGERPTIPAPTLEFVEGDTAKVILHNNLDEETSIHWHGLIVPNNQDGVPYLTNPPIKARSTYTFNFPIKQSGTYWYHSHTSLQEQRGVYGAIVIHPLHEDLAYDIDQLVVLSDWTNRDPNQIMNRLKTDPDYEQICKGTRRGWVDDLREGTIQQRLESEKNRMGPMDVADVCYDAFLINGRSRSRLENIVPGQKVRLRFINASSSTYFNVFFGKQPMEVVAADGIRVEPVKVSSFQIGMAETYDVIVTIPNNIAIELRATSPDVSGHTSVIFGKGPLELAPDLPKPNPYAMNMPMGGGSHQCKLNEHWDDTMKGQ
jgi:FtsP/CotA-like multicopper oxidase with cupredoxin domain